MSAKGGVKKGGKRLDALLVERGLVDTRARARAVIMAGSVFVAGERVDKAGELVKGDAEIVLKGEALKYVSRGGLKLEAALDAFGVDVTGMTAVDIGSSTGGFTDCLLQRGASRVYAIDAGRGQLDWKLRNDPRVVSMEKFNARYLRPEDIGGEPVGVAVIDVSFISLTKIIPPAAGALAPGGTLIALIKPQFEVGKGEVGKGGIVRDETKRKEVVDKITAFASGLGMSVKGVVESPITGADGNVEYLVCAVKR
ncbi:MAG: TlyA family RNA methyltransferase [Candidatus Dadabacteria bacterium]|nr:TlyA family RNA methyltransferase [Candidatus Dadabacteria bacterium]